MVHVDKEVIKWANTGRTLVSGPNCVAVQKSDACVVAEGSEEGTGKQ